MEEALLVAPAAVAEVVRSATESAPVWRASARKSSASGASARLHHSKLHRCESHIRACHEHVLGRPGWMQHRGRARFGRRVARCCWVALARHRCCQAQAIFSPACDAHSVTSACRCPAPGARPLAQQTGPDALCVLQQSPVEAEEEQQRHATASTDAQN